VPDAKCIEFVDLWVAIPEEISAQQLEIGYRLLTPEERERQQAFVFERNRREYLVTRAMVRTVLSQYRPIPAPDWNFRRNPYGRPEIDPPCGLRFNLSNHPTMVVCAVRNCAEDGHDVHDVGVDVEPIDRGADVLAIAETVFAASELRSLRDLPAEQQPDRALSLWTLKEAYIKARGMGLSLPLQEFAFSFAKLDALQIEFSTAIVDDPVRWHFVTIDRDRHRIAIACALAGGEVAVRVSELRAFAQ
jgi:4'-phosphopantetheinyl transferase